MTANNTDSLKQAFPSVDLAYTIAVDSYDVLMKRSESVDGRLQTMLALFASVTAVVPAVGASRGLSFHSKWFYVAIGAMALAVIVRPRSMTSSVARMTPTCCDYFSVKGSCRRSCFCSEGVPRFVYHKVACRVVYRMRLRES